MVVLTSLQRVPFIGGYFVNEIPPEDNVSDLKNQHGMCLYWLLTAYSPSNSETREAVGKVGGAVIESGHAGLV